MYLDDLPSAASEYQGCSLKIPRELLTLSVEEFTARNDVPEDDSMALIAELQEQAEKIKEEAHYPKAAPRYTPVACVRTCDSQSSPT